MNSGVAFESVLKAWTLIKKRESRYFSLNSNVYVEMHMKEPGKFKYLPITPNNEEIFRNDDKFID